MQSKISIDLDYYNNPVLKIKCWPTDDVRDKLVNQFVNKSPFFQLSELEGVGNQTIDYTINVIEPTETKEFLEEVEKWRKKNYPKIECSSGYDSSTVDSSPGIRNKVKILTANLPNFLFDTINKKNLTEFDDENENHRVCIMTWYKFKDFEDFFDKVSTDYSHVVLFKGIEAFKNVGESIHVRMWALER